MSDTVGTPRKLVINGISFDFMGDVNITFKRAKFETEGVPTTGRTLFKMTKVVQTKEGVNVAAVGDEVELLKNFAESLTDLTLMVEYADTTVYRGTGRINFESWESETGSATLILIPKNDWTAFTA